MRWVNPDLDSRCFLCATLEPRSGLNEFAELSVIMLFKRKINSEPQFNKIFFSS